VSKKYNYVIVGSGFFGSICAYELNKIGKKCLVLERRNHIGGNCYTEERDNINLHLYGPHIFHTSNEEVWKWINQFVEFNDFTLRPVANYKSEIYSLPFNMWTFSKMWNISHPEQAKEIINEQSQDITEPKNLEEQAIKLVGKDVYYKLIKGYTEKQWRKSATELPKEIIQRLPIRFTYDNNYFNDKYQGIPIGGYTQIFSKLLKDVDIELSVDYLDDPEYWDNIAENVIYTGPIDAYFKYEFGELEYKTNFFKHERLETQNHQGVSMMTYTDIDVPYTRCIEHKHFENSKSDFTWISFDYPSEYNRYKEPFYPVNDDSNNQLYQKYLNKVDKSRNVYFGGRLAEYKYYDMDKVIDRALNFVKELIN
jgi:UDP-galactopyranose mutase